MKQIPQCLNLNEERKDNDIKRQQNNKSTMRSNADLKCAAMQIRVRGELNAY
ncbi:MAG: hypothetical protein KAS13_05870 [Candidatus Omnitrophica bacterium]|nr:hypothetical protein [Candidatus Omnitrophota bacterium]